MQLDVRLRGDYQDGPRRRAGSRSNITWPAHQKLEVRREET